MLLKKGSSEVVISVKRKGQFRLVVSLVKQGQFRLKWLLAWLNRRSLGVVNSEAKKGQFRSGYYSV